MITTIEQVRELFDYRDGALYWKHKASKRHSIDDPAGTINATGYRIITLDGKKYQAHRLIWLWHGKELPKQLDHINGDKTDNHIENLRVTDYVTNQYNRGAPANNSSGVKGVSWCNTYGKWIVQIRHNKKMLNGRFGDFFDAVCFAFSKRRELHGDFAYEVSHV